jgi:hypothetical protein
MSKRVGIPVGGCRTDARPRAAGTSTVRRAARAALCAAVAAVATAAAPALSGQAAAAVWTDQQHYSPGSTVTISGDNSDAAGYAAGETVEVLIGEPDGGSTSCSATADGSGAWSCQITLAADTSAIGGYTYTVTGQSSGVSQSGTFSDAGCPAASALGNQKQDPNVSASYTTSGGKASYSFTSPKDTPVGGIPGLIEYCVYTEPQPASETAVYANLDGAWAVDEGSGFFAFGRSDGNPNNVPFDGSTQAIGNATWSGSVPAEQTIVLHINDTAECSALYGGKVETCFVTPGSPVVKAKGLEASVTADPSFTRTFKWQIEKAAETSEIDNAGSATFKYTVTVSHDGGTDSNWENTGEISVTNPNAAPVSGIEATDAINDPAASCKVTGGTGVTVAAGSTVKLKYSCTYSAAPAKPSETDTATVKWPAQTLADSSVLEAGSTTATAAVEWNEVAPTIVDGSVTVTDPLGGGTLGTVSSTDPSPKTFEYSHEFSGDPAGTCTEHENTATFTTNTTGTKGAAEAKVKHCVGADLKVQKSASASFTRTFKWGIEKSAEPPEIDNEGAATFKYKVSVSHDTGSDSGWVVAGTITVTNPNNWESVSLTEVADQIDNGGNCSITSGNPTATLAAGKSTQLGYECTYPSGPSAASFTNKATASWSAAAAHTPDGTASGTAAGSFGSPSVVDGSVTVTDPLGGGTLGTVSAAEASPAVFEYAHEFAEDPVGTCISHENTATFKASTSGSEGSAKATVKHCVSSPPPTCSQIYGLGHLNGKEVSFDDKMSTNLAVKKQNFEISWEFRLHHMHQYKLLSATCTINGNTDTFSGEGLVTIDKVKGYRVVFSLTLIGKVQYVVAKVYKESTLLYTFEFSPQKGWQIFS